MMALRPLQKMAQNAKRYEAMRDLCLMTEDDREKIYAAMDDRGLCCETKDLFDIDADNLIAVLASIKEAK